MPFPMKGSGDMVLALIFPTACDALSGRLGLDQVRAPILAEPETVHVIIRILKHASFIRTSSDF